MPDPLRKPFPASRTRTEAVGDGNPWLPSRGVVRAPVALQLQRLAGNAAVARLLAPSSAKPAAGLSASNSSGEAWLAGNFRVPQLTETPSERPESSTIDSTGSDGAVDSPRMPTSSGRHEPVRPSRGNSVTGQATGRATTRRSSRVSEPAAPPVQTVEVDESATRGADRSVEQHGTATVSADTGFAPPREPRPDRRWGRALAVQRGLLDDAVGGVAGLAGGVRDSLLETLAGWARRMPGYELLCTVLGRDVVAGTPVPQSATAVINGFLGLMPRGDELRQQLQQSGALEKAGAWFEEEVPKLGLSWETIRGLFTRAWEALSTTDLLDPEGAWAKISGIFSTPLARLRNFAVGAVTTVAEFVFEGAMAMAGGAGSQVMGVIRRAGDVLNQIVRDPVGFASNLVAAVRGGLGAFLSNIGTHLRNGLIGWLTGSLGGIIRLPTQFDLRGILGMAMEFLGLTWQNIRPRIARVIGDRTLGFLERGAGIVADIARNGISALTGRIAQFTSGLVDTVLGGIREWVTNSVVGAAITRLISMFNPAGAVIQAIIAVYNTIQFFIERAQQLGALATSIFNSISAIASGAIGNAVSAVEQALGRTVPVVLGFLARLIGLGDVAAPVRNIMTRARTMIDSALDRVIGWIAGLARRIGGALRAGVRMRGGVQPPTSNTPERQKEIAVRGATAAVAEVLNGPGGDVETARAAVPRIKDRFKVTTLEVTTQPQGPIRIHAALNPTSTLTYPGGAALLAGVNSLGIVGFLEQMITNGRVGQVTWRQFNTIWASDQATVDWLKNKFRDAMPYNHEWIPSNLILDVADKALGIAGPDRQRIRAALKWVTLQHQLRTPTRAVIWKFAVQAPSRPRGRYSVEIGAHTGSFVNARDIAEIIGTAGTGAFHDNLRNRFGSSGTMTAAAFARALKTHVLANVWDGNGIPNDVRRAPIGDFGLAYYIDDTSPSADITLHDLSVEQRRNYRTISIMFDSVIAAVG